MAKVIPVDKVYKLKNGNPLSYTLASRNHPRFPLMWFDEKNNVNRALRYASNQKSPFEDEQDGNAIIEPIIFDDGFLRVPKNNPVLQQFLHYHPLNGIIFTEVDKEKEAAEEVDDLNLEVEALVEARQLTIEQLETLTRVMFGKDPSTVSTAELKRDILVFAKNEPENFVNLLDDPMLNTQSTVQIFFEKRLLVFKNQNKEIWFNTPSNKKKMMNVPFGADPYAELVEHFTSKEGLDALKMLESNLELM